MLGLCLFNYLSLAFGTIPYLGNPSDFSHNGILTKSVANHLPITL